MTLVEWRPLPGREGEYDVSNLGQIRSQPRRRTRGGILRVHVNRRGYLTLNLGRKTHEVHRLVALAFLGPRPDGMEVRHLDGDRLNPRADNLAYGTRGDNLLDAVTHGTHPKANRTHCPQGHPYDQDNTRLYRGRRSCRTCGGWKGHPDYQPEWTP